MKIKLVYVVLMFLAFNSIEANQTLAIDSKQIKEMIKTNTLYIVGVDEKSKWNKSKIKVKRQSYIAETLRYSSFSFNHLHS